MSRIQTFRNLIAWQKGVPMGLSVYRLTSSSPKDELYGLASQMRRAGVSVASNIAEGYGRGTKGDYLRFLQTSRASVCELETQAEFARALEYSQPDTVSAFCVDAQEVQRILAGLIRSPEETVREAGEDYHA